MAKNKHAVNRNSLERCRVALGTLVVLVGILLPLSGSTPPLIPTFETGLSPTIEIHVAPTGNDTTGDGSSATPYATIARGIQDAGPGAAVRIHPGTYDVRVSLTNLSGTAANPIWIGGVPNAAKPVIQGHSEGIHLTRTRHLILHDLEIRNTTQNGINCDDGGDYANPEATRHMIFRDLYIHDIGGTGNQDGLKLSGVDDYFVLDCEIARCGGGISGSGIDHVGCHNGVIAYNKIHDISGSGIQCKGGSENLDIRANRIRDFGQRSVNIGGSTGFTYFRPPLSTTGPNFEARDIRLNANIIEGGVASLAFVGCINCEAVNNTFINPTRWLVRILQETTTSGGFTFLACANNTVRNNLFYFDRGALANSSINIGANTNPASFTWTNNLWFAHNNAAQSHPNPNPVQTNAVIGDDPALADPATGDYWLRAGSPAIAAGLASSGTDYAGAPFKNPPSIGAFEVTAWQAWRALHFPDPAQLANPVISGPDATPGGDGIANYKKFAFNLDPFNNETANFPAATLAADHLEFVYTRPANSNCHVAVTIEVSENLTDWLSGPSHTLTQPPSDLGDGTELITVEDRTSLSTAPRRFIRAAVHFFDGG